MSDKTPPEHYDDAAASIYLRETHGLKKAVSTLARYRTVGGGPRYFRHGRQPRYLVTSLDAWAAGIKAATHTSTATESGGAL
jgi:hypothetical protein